MLSATSYLANGVHTTHWWPALAGLERHFGLRQRWCSSDFTFFHPFNTLGNQLCIRRWLGGARLRLENARFTPQPRDVNAIEQLRTAREATTIDFAAIDAPAANARNLAQLIAGHARTADCS